jgi:hypothetical protein
LGVVKRRPLLFSSTLPNTPRLVELLDDILDLHPQAEAKLKGRMTTYLASLLESEAKTEGIKLGEAIASKLLAARANDGADAPESYRPRTTPGVFVPTAITVSSTWPKVTPFAMTSPSQFRPSAPVGGRVARRNLTPGRSQIRA